jgi:HAMP domain-containing protein
MKLLAKFSLLFIFVFGSGLAAAAYFAYQFLEQNVKEEVLQQARLMLQSALAMRDYTSNEIAPLLDTPAMRKSKFLPQTIPFYAATQSFNALRRHYHDYAYKEATLNPTNLRDRAVDWEADVISSFKDNPGSKELIGQRSTPNGMSLFLARPITVGQECLGCHGSSASAPPSLLRIYGSANGFGWKRDDIVGAQIVSVPMSVPVSIARQAFQNLMIYLGSVALATLIVLDLALYFVVVRPVRKLAAAAEEISNGNMDGPKIQRHGRDEIAGLAQSFNRMRVSLAKAIHMLENQPG